MQITEKREANIVGSNFCELSSLQIDAQAIWKNHLLESFYVCHILIFLGVIRPPSRILVWSDFASFLHYLIIPILT
mgnify:CR=1 FL=1